MRIFLLGFMGVGKSTLGRYAAEQLSLEFLDFDTMLEDDQQMSISEIFANFGEVFFRKLEHDLLREVIQSRDHFIMGTGGGLPCFHHNLDTMNKHGYTVYLRAGGDAIADRLTHSSGSRPLIMNKTDEELRQYVYETLQKREFFYQQATRTIDIDLHMSKQDNADRLVFTLRELISYFQIL